MRDAQPSTPNDAAASADADLYRAAVGGDRDAAADLVRRHHRQLVAFGMASGWSRSDVEDAVQLAWTRLFQQLQLAARDPSKALRKPDSIHFWLATTMLNALRQEHRHSKRQETLVEREAMDSEATGRSVFDPDLLERLELEERRTVLRRAFGRLNAACQELIAALLVDPPLSYAEISQLIGRPQGSIGPTRQRCIDNLRTLIGSQPND